MTESKSKAVSVTLDRDVCFGNDLLTGELRIQAVEPNPVTYRSVMVVLWARFIEIPPNGGQGDIVTLYISKRPVVQKLEVVPGDDPFIVAFEFTVPADAPPTIVSKHGLIQWRVSVVHESPQGRGAIAAASKLFRKSALYHSIAGLVPTAQNETKQVGSGNTLRAEATLAKDVFVEGEDIGITITIHETGTTKAPAVTGVRARIVQRMRVSNKGHMIMRPLDVKLAKTRVDIGNWPMIRLAGDLGTVTESTIYLKPVQDGPGHATRCAHQILQRADYPTRRKQINALAPTCKFTSNENKEVYLTYEVQVDIRVPSGHDILLTLPFTLQSEPREALATALEDADSEDLLMQIAMFPTVDDDLPTYDEVPQLSVPAYSSLRRGSVGSVFAAAVHDGAAYTSVQSLPSYTECSDSESGVSPAVRPRRSSSATALDAPTSGRNRRSSFTAAVSRFARSDRRSVSNVPQDAADGSLGTPQTERRKSAASIFLENSVSATATRTIRRLRASTTGAANNPRHRHSGSPTQGQASESPSEVFANFKARYNTPIVILEPTQHD